MNLLDLIAAFFELFGPHLPPVEPVIAPQTPAEPTLPTEPPPTPPIPETPKYDWSTPTAARHSVRVICDEEGLTLEQKNTLCATVACESGFNIHAKHYNFSKSGKLLSTDFGLAQWNDYYHGAEITPDEAEYNPAKAIRLMCAYWKRNQRKLWVCYDRKMYEAYL